MKKHSFFRAVSIFLSLTLLVLSFASCKANTQKPDKDFYKKFSLKSSATISPADLQKNKVSFKGTDGAVIKVHFERPTKINTVVLCEKGDNILSFRIAALDLAEKALKSIYEQDKVGSFRYCAFKEVETTDLEITILKSKENSFTLKELDVLFSTTDRNDLRVSSYVVTDTVLDASKLDKAHFDTITDILLFGALRFDEQGNIIENEFTLGDEKLTGKEAVKLALQNIKEVCGENMPTVYLNLLGPDGDVDTKEEKHNIVFEQYGDKLIQNINALIEEFSLEGIGFDYEYPYKSSGWKTFSNFLIQLKQEMPQGKRIAIAVGPWGKTLTNEAKKAVDVLEVMTYDLFDDDGYHASFQGAVDGLNYMTKKSYPLMQCDLGLPFYGRPTGRYAYWSNYFEVYEQLGKNGNVCVKEDTVMVNEDGKEVEKPVGDCYYNSYQMIYDKTAYALDYGVGGLMIWHYACDVPVDTGLSLFDAIEQAIQDRTA